MNETLKQRCRAASHRAKREGRLIPQPCEAYNLDGTRCGNLKVDMHHADYEQPLVVNWYCRAHHRELHCNLLKVPEDGRVVAVAFPVRPIWLNCETAVSFLNSQGYPITWKVFSECLPGGKPSPMKIS
jgi:hypothetical protein